MPFDRVGAGDREMRTGGFLAPRWVVQHFPNYGRTPKIIGAPLLGP